LTRTDCRRSLVNQNLFLFEVNLLMQVVDMTEKNKYPTSLVTNEVRSPTRSNHRYSHRLGLVLQGVSPLYAREKQNSYIFGKPYGTYIKRKYGKHVNYKNTESIQNTYEHIRNKYGTNTNQIRTIYEHVRKLYEQHRGTNTEQIRKTCKHL
jgi:hypothetical protein